MGNIGDEVEKLYGRELEEKKNNTSSKTTKKNRLSLYLTLTIIMVILILPGVFYWNRFVNLQQTVFTKQGQMDKEYQRRNDLIPNLIEVTKDYARHERELFKYVSDVRAGLESAENLMKEMKKIEKVKGKDILSKIMALAEQYPDLKATQSFQDLMDKLEEQENRLADTRESYNRAAQRYNTVLISFPSSAYNIFFGFELVPYFHTEGRIVVKINDIKSGKSFRQGEVDNDK